MHLVSEKTPRVFFTFFLFLHFSSRIVDLGSVQVLHPASPDMLFQQFCAVWDAYTFI